MVTRFLNNILVLNNLFQLDLLKHKVIIEFLDSLTTFAISDANGLLTSFNKIYPTEVELKTKHQCNHASFLDLNIKTENGVFA